MAVLSVLAGTSSAQARAVAIRLSALPERVATADAVVVGKVTGIEEKAVSAESFPGAKDKAEFHIAIVKVQDAVLGTKDLTHVKIGFIKPPQGKPIIRPGGYRPPQPMVDQEGCFFLTKHPTETFYLLQGFNSIINKTGNDNFAKEMERVKECAKLMADPKAGLKAKDADSRALTAAMLVLRYTMPQAGQTKREDIGAEESKQILTALAGGDWTKTYSLTELPPSYAFGRLTHTEKDGWNWKPAPGDQPTAYQDAAKAWLKDNAGTYRIQRFVSDKKDEKKDK